MRKIVIIGLAAGLLGALPAQAATSNGSANRNEAMARDQQAGSSSAGDRRICVRDERSESRIRRQVCHTAQEWRDLDGEVPGQH